MLQRKWGRPFACLVVVALMGCGNLWAQAPMGVDLGTPGANGNILNWLIPEASNCLTDSCIVASVNDTFQVPHALFAGPGSVTYQESELNFNPLLQTQGGGHLVFPQPADLNSNIMVFLVFRPSSLVGTQTRWHDEAGILSARGAAATPSDAWGVTMQANTLEFSINDDATPLVSQPNIPLGANADPTLASITLTNANPGIAELFISGTSVGTGSTGGFTPDLDDANDMYIGEQEGASVNTAWDGYFGDVIIYDAESSNNQRERVESYLALKYGFTLGHSYRRNGGNVIYALDGVFDFDIAGVARNDNSLLHQRQSIPTNSSTAIKMGMYHGTGYAGTFPTVNSAVANTNANLGNNEYLIAGHNNSSPAFTAQIGPGAPAAGNRMQRIYKANDDGGTGTVTLLFPNAFGLTSGLTTYHLVTSTDTLFGPGDTFTQMTETAAMNGDYYVEIDFPDNQETYFTISATNTFIGPGGVADGLELWIKADSGVTPPVGVTAWEDLSGFGNDLGNVAAGVNVTVGGINFNDHVAAGALDREFSTTNTFTGQTIFVVGRASGGINNNDGYVGFDGDEGLRQDGNTAVEQIKKNGNGNDWTDNAGGLLKRNGAATVLGGINEWTVMTGKNDNPHGPEEFFVGGYFNGRTYGAYDFAEVLVYSNDKSAGNDANKIETYLGLKYGVTIEHNYFSSGVGMGTLIYDRVGYTNDIAGVGRDDNSLLDQRQSLSINSDAILTVGVDTIEATNDANPNQLGDQNYFIWGNDGGDPCWSNEDIQITGEEHRWLRIDREWQYWEADPFGNGIRTFFRMDPDNPNFDLPALPGPGNSTTYYLILDDDGNFRNGGTTTFPMTLVGGNYEVELTTGDRNTPSGPIPPPRKYFTFGTRMDSSALHPALCYGDTIDFTGSNLEGGICTEIVLTSATRTFTLTEDIAIGDSMFLPLAPTSTDNCLDVLRWVASDSLPFGTYAVRTQRAATCAGPFSGPLERQLFQDSITVGSGVTGGISFSGIDSLFLCLGDPNPVITVDSGPLPPSTPASFQVLSSSTNQTVLQLMDSSAIPFEVYIHSGNIGTHVIGYDPGGSCPNLDSVKIIIDSLQASSFSFSTTTVCGANPFSQPLPARVPLNGTFSSLPVMSPPIDAITGAFVPANQDTGQYVIIYTPSDSCYAADTFLLRLEPERVAQFDYGTGSFCINDSNPIPNITFIPPGVNPGFTCTSANSANITLDPITGEIDLTASDTGSYDIAYSLTGTCARDSMVTIEIKPLPSVSFTMPSQVCTTTDTVMPTLLSPPGNYHWSNWTGDLRVDPNNGHIIIDSSNVGGPFPVTLRHDSTNGCSDSTILPLTIIGVPNTAITYANTFYCQNDSNPFPTLQTGVGGGNFFSTPVTPALDPSTGELNVGTMGPGIYIVEYALPVSFCPADTITVDTITIDTVPDASFTLDRSQVCRGDTLPITITYAGAWQFTANIYDGANLVNSNVVGNFPVAGLADSTTYAVQNTAHTNIFNPSLGCQDTAIQFFTVLTLNPSDFTYGGTICNNVDDPTPLITGVGGGFFFQDSTGQFPAIVDSMTGVLDLDGLGNITQVVHYTSPGPCPTTSTDIITVLPGLKSDFTYPTVRTCTDDSALIPNFIDTLAGTWTVHNTNSTIAITQTNGNIDLLASTITSPIGIDSFIVRHNVGGNGQCKDSTDILVFVTKFDTSWGLSYPPGVFCETTNEAVPLITRLNPNQTGTFTQPPGLLFSSLDSGIVSVNQSVVNTHVINFTSNGDCEETTSTQLQIINSGDARFQYGNNSICYADSNTTLLPTFLVDSSGIFSASPVSPFDTLNFIDNTTGEIDVSNSTPGEFDISYITIGNCPDTVTNTVFINDKPDAGLLEARPGTSVCDSQEVSFSLTGSLGGTVSYFWRGVMESQSPVWSERGFATGDTVLAVVENAFSCTDSAFVIMETTPKPETRILTRPTVLTGADPIQIDIGPTLDQTQIFWNVITGEFITVDRKVGFTDTLDVGESATLENLTDIRSDVIPDSLIYIFTAISRGCIGDPDSITIYVNPNEFPVFVPEVMTPNGDMVNDTWKVQLQSGLAPERFQMNVYNPQGGLVFDMSPIHANWDGGLLPDGVYWWVLKDLDGVLPDFAGGLTIRRK